MRKFIGQITVILLLVTPTKISLVYVVSKNGGDARKLDGGYSSRVITQSKTQVYFASLDDIYSFRK